MWVGVLSLQLLHIFQGNFVQKLPKPYYLEEGFGLGERR
jgi:hypothetical protein